MNRGEVTALIRRLARHFPDFGNWFANQSKELVDAWCETLARTSAEDANHAVTDWVTGIAPFVAAYEREQVPQRIVQACRAKENARRVLEDSRRLIRQARKQPENNDGFVSGAWILRKALELRMLIAKGEISDVERDAIIAREIERIGG